MNALNAGQENGASPYARYEISPLWREMTHEQVELLDQRATEGASWEFYCGSYIHHPAVFGHKLSGKVQDAIDEYFTEIRISDKEMVTDCSCGERSGVCKHAIALLYGWVEDSDGFVNVADTLERLRHKDQEDLLEILGRIIMFDLRMIDLIEDDLPAADLEDESL
jgi:uncharacterized Zn finger protein